VECLVWVGFGAAAEADAALLILQERFPSREGSGIVRIMQLSPQPVRLAENF